MWVWLDSGYKPNRASCGKVGHCPTQEVHASDRRPEDLSLWDFGSDTALHPSPLQPTEKEIFPRLKSLSELPEQG